MKTSATELPGVVIVEPLAFDDARGYFFEAFHSDRYATAGIAGPFVQDNVSSSCRGVLRGLHCQQPHMQSKLVSVLLGEVFDVAVDLRLGSPTFGKWTGHILSDANKRQLYVPAGFAHGFLTMSPRALVTYKCSDFYHVDAERTIRWDDQDIGIEWPSRDVTLSDKDRAGLSLREIVPALGAGDLG